MYCNRQRLERFGSRRQREKRRRLGFQGQPEQYRLQFNSVRIFFFLQIFRPAVTRIRNAWKVHRLLQLMQARGQRRDGMGPPGWAGRRGPEVSGEAILARQKKNLRGRFLQKRRKERDFALAENELFFLSVRLFSAFSVFVSHPHPRGASF